MRKREWGWIIAGSIFAACCVARDVMSSKKVQARFLVGAWLGAELVLFMSDVHTFHDLALWIVSGWMVAAYFCVVHPTFEREEKPLFDVKSARVEMNADGETVIFAVDGDLRAYELRPGDEGYADAVEQILAKQPELAVLFALVQDE